MCKSFSFTIVRSKNRQKNLFLPSVNRTLLYPSPPKITVLSVRSRLLKINGALTFAPDRFAETRDWISICFGGIFVILVIRLSGKRRLRRRYYTTKSERTREGEESANDWFQTNFHLAVPILMSMRDMHLFTYS